jgi:hypothetical protein
LLQVVVVVLTIIQTAVQVVAQLVLRAHLIQITFHMVLSVAQGLLSLLLVLRRARQAHPVHSVKVDREDIVLAQVVVVVGMEAVAVGMTQVVVVVLDI